MRWPWEKKAINEAANFSVFIDSLRSQFYASSGAVVSPQTALQVATVLICVRVIAEGISQVPFKLYRDLPNGDKNEARDHNLFRLLHRTPNDYQSSFEFREQIIFHAAMTGNAYVFISRGTDGKILELLPFEPGSVTVRRDGSQIIGYDVRARGGTQINVPPSNIWHLRGPSWDGMIGMNAVHVARNTIGLALSTEEFAAGLFKNGARPGGMMIPAETLGNDKMQKLKEAWEASHSGSENAFKTAFLPFNLKYEKLAFSSDEIEFDKTRVATVLDICRFFRVQPIMAMHMDNQAAFASVEQRYIAHYRDTLAPWYARVEQSATNALLSPEDRDKGLYAEFDARGLLRGSAKERAEYYALMTQNGFMTQNEVRQAENMTRLNDPLADNPRLAANLYGPSKAV
jgi:HK97 family phage portal protein